MYANLHHFKKQCVFSNSTNSKSGKCDIWLQNYIQIDYLPKARPSNIKSSGRNIPVSAIRFFEWDLLTMIQLFVKCNKTCAAISTFIIASVIALFSFRLLSFSLLFNHSTNPQLNLFLKPKLSAGSVRISKPFPRLQKLHVWLCCLDTHL